MTDKDDGNCRYRGCEEMREEKGKRGGGGNEWMWNE